MTKNIKRAHGYLTVCQFGRSKFDEAHTVCRSCQKNSVKCTLRKRRKDKRPASAGPEMVGGKKAWVVYGESTPSLNEWTGKNRWAYSAIRKKWWNLTNSSSFHFGRAEKRRAITIVRVVVSRSSIMDHDNFIGGLKPVVDAFKNHGVIVDDDDTWIRWDKAEQLVGAPARVEIFFEEI